MIARQGAVWSARQHFRTPDHPGFGVVLISRVHRCWPGALGLGVLACCKLLSLLLTFAGQGAV